MKRFSSTSALLPPLLAGVVLASCAPPPVVVVAPAMDPEQEALRLEDHTELEEPLRIVFDWQVNEQGTRVSGRGVARIEPPYKARLDLFHGSGEGVISAVLVNGELQLPPDAPTDILPPADLMWSVLGVFRPMLGTELIGADHLENDGVRLRYRYDNGKELHYVVEGGILNRVEMLESGSVVQRVALDLEANGRYPVEATYRNLADFRELKITRDQLYRVDPFPPDTWAPVWTRGRQP